MAIETFGFIDDLNAANPTATDNVSEGDDHLRGLKTTLKNTFPNVTGAINATEAELNILDGVTSTAAELNILDGVTATTAELNYVDGVTSAIQTQVSGKLAKTGGTLTGDLLIDKGVNNARLTLGGGYVGQIKFENHPSVTNWMITSQYVNSNAFEIIPSTTVGGDTFTTPLFQITSDGRGLSQFTAKAWVNFDGTSTVSIRDSHNVSSITDNGTGSYSVNLSVAQANLNYSVVVGGYRYIEASNNLIDLNGNYAGGVETVSKIRMATQAGFGPWLRDDYPNNYCIVFGD